MASGEASVKIVYAEDPAKALREFYERRAGAARSRVTP
jgi:hypothetical protein